MSEPMQTKIDLFLSQMAEIDRRKAMRVERFCAMTVPWQFNTHFIVKEYPAAGSNRQFSSLASAVNYLQMVAPDLTRLEHDAEIEIVGSWTKPDSGAVNFTGFKTNSCHYLNIYREPIPFDLSTGWDIGTYNIEKNI
jgi:hypothetical protein